MKHDKPKTLNESQEHLGSLFRMQAEMNQKVIDHMSSFKDVLNTYRELFHETGGMLNSIGEAMRENLSIIKELNDSLESMRKAITDNYTATQENNERLERLLTKVEAYFGTTGLDYDN